MPPRNYRKKRTKKRTQKRMTTRLRIPKPRTYNFIRTQEELLALENPDAGATGWSTTFDDCVFKTFSFSLANLPNPAEFTGLFAQYKLNGCALKIFPTYSQIVSTTSPGTNSPANIIITVWRNTHGTPLTAAFTKAELNQIQAKKQWMFPLNRPTSLYMNLRQLSNTYNSTINNDYVTMKPKYLSTAETGTPHYGINVHIQKVDGSTFGAESPRLKIMEKIYLTMKQVK